MFKLASYFKRFFLCLSICFSYVVLANDINSTNYIAQKIIPEDSQLRWFDIVTSYTIQGPKGPLLVVEMDTTKIRHVQFDQRDPYWFQYYRSFWRGQNGTFIGDIILRDDANKNSGVCKNPTNFRNYEQVLGFTERGRREPYASKDYFAATFYDVRTCVSANRRGGSIDSPAYYLHHKFVRKIEGFGTSWYPGHAPGLGESYYQLLSNQAKPIGSPLTMPKALTTTVNLKIYLNEYVQLAAENYLHYGAGYWRDVRAGEVTRDGFGIVPMLPSPNGAPDQFNWVFIIPKGENVVTGNAAPTHPFGTNRPVNLAGRRLIIDPPFFNILSPHGADQTQQARQRNNSELLLGMVDTGSALGAGDKVDPQDFSAEGFYDLKKRSDGTWEYTRLNQESAWSRIQATRSLTINGSGNNFTSGIYNGQLMAEKMGLTESVHYYLPQEIGPVAYATAANASFRDSVRYVFAKARDTNTYINLQSHSWSGYAVFNTSPQDSEYINHISYTPATLPKYWDSLGNDVRNWKGKAHIIYSANDVLSGSTISNIQNGVILNSNVDMTNVSAGHSLINVLNSANSRIYWR